MAGVKVRRFTLLAADKNAQNELEITLDASNIGFNPTHQFSKAQIACNEYDAAGEFTVQFRPSGADDDFFLPFISQEGGAAQAGTDIVLLGRQSIDPLFDALKIKFTGVAAENVQLYVGFIEE